MTVSWLVLAPPGCGLSVAPTCEVGAAGTVSWDASVEYVATDVGLWMALPAFGPALAVVGAVFYVVRRDRRRERDAAADVPSSKDVERNRSL